MGGRIAGVLVGIVVGLMASPAAAQSLADVARQESARREQLRTTGKTTDGKVLTNADLPASAVVAQPGSPAPADAAVPGGEAGDADKDAKPQGDAGPTPASAAATLAAKANSAPTDDEPGWRARAERVNGALAAARAQVRQLKALSDRLSLEAQASNPAIAARAQAERTELQAQILAAQDKEAAALADRMALEQEARVAGVPPAWLQ